MIDFIDWKTQNVSAVTTTTKIVQASTAAQLPEIAQAGAAITVIYVNQFTPAQNPDSVPDQAFTDLQNKIDSLSEAIENSQSKSSTHAFKCKDDFDRCCKNANTKSQKTQCFATYLACLAHGFTTIIGD
jgi:hypothetical protein